jgi:hypothetical protein
MRRFWSLFNCVDRAILEPAAFRCLNIYAPVGTTQTPPRSPQIETKTRPPVKPGRGFIESDPAGDACPLILTGVYASLLGVTGVLPDRRLIGRIVEASPTVPIDGP